jgi:ubiquinone/menaquinone biosynthesis C-methylase UbiE
MPFPKVTVDKLPVYRGLEWENKINSPDHPNFWKYGVANLIFLDYAAGKSPTLDLGCGTGGLTLSLAQEGEIGWIVGVDVVKDMVRVARRKASGRKLSDRVCFVVCDGRHLPFKTACFEALVSRGDAFCFLVPMKCAVDEIRRVVKPDGVVSLELDNRVDWKPGTIVSSSFQKTATGGIAYVEGLFTVRRNHRATSYVLDPKGRIAKKIMSDREFQEKSTKACSFSSDEVKRETIEIKQGVWTHWPTARGLARFFRKAGYSDVRVVGDGLLMKLLLDGDEAVVETMKRFPQVFFEIERELVPYVKSSEAPTLILHAIVPPR